MFGARSYADLRVDFNGNPAPNSPTAAYTGYFNASTTLLRLRTAHAGLQWEHTEAYFSLDHPIFAPDMPTSLTAVAVPPLAWSGNLWTWNPQVGVTRDFGPSDSQGIRLQAALIDVGDAPISPPPTSSTLAVAPPNSAEQSRWPGAEARVALQGPQGNSNEDRNHFGIGGYFAPHYSNVLGHGFDSWAGTLDARLNLFARLEFSGSFYRGLALGGLGGGAFKDVAYRIDPDSGGYYFRPLDDVGGWAQLKERVSERLELNAAFGIDNVFADELRPYAVAGGKAHIEVLPEIALIQATRSIVPAPISNSRWNIGTLKVLRSLVRRRQAISSVWARDIDFDEEKEFRQVDCLRCDAGVRGYVCPESESNAIC